MFSRDDRGDDLFVNSTIDTSNPDKIIIREKEAPRKKVRRRVKKGTKEQVLYRKQQEKELKKAQKEAEKAARKQEKERRFDTLTMAGFDVVELEEKLKESKESRKDIAKARAAYEDTAKGYRIPKLSDIDKKNSKKDDFDNDFGTDFRKSSADWKDQDYNYPSYAGLDDLSSGSGSSSFFDGFKNATWIQWVAFGLAAALFVSSILTTNVYARLQCYDNRAEAMATLTTYEDNSFTQVAEAVESVEAPLSLEEAKPQLGKVLSLVLSSVEKDLKIKLVDEDDTLVKNVPWSVTVTDNDGSSSEESDDDQDGIIHMTDISAGEYSVTLNPSDALSEYELPMVAQSVSVRAKVEYKVIADIKEEIKSEKEVNAAAEDAAGNQAADVETGPPVTPQEMVTNEEYIEAIPDLSKTAKLKTENKLMAVIDKIRTNAASNFGYKAVGYPVLLTGSEPTDPPTETPAETPTETPAKCPPHNYENGKCKDCGATDPDYKPAHECKLSYEKKDDTNHTVKCTADGCDKGYPKDEAHALDGNKCSKCGYEKPQEHTHNYSGAVTSNKDGTHSVKCTGCDSTEKKNCTYDSNGKCSVCGYQKPAEDHKLTYTPNKNGTHKVTCSVSGCSQNHNKDSESCTFDGGKCKYCGYAKEDKSLSLSGDTTVKVGGTTTITATLSPSSAKITSASIADTSIATASVSGTAITVKGVKAGETKLTVKADNDKESSVTIKVKEVEYADDAQLYDSNKNALYVKEGDSYRLAKYRDYKNDPSQKFYRKKMNETGLGIDVSKYQPSINWSSVKAAGVDYVIIRCGYRGSDTGVLVEDPYFKSHIKGAKAAGLKVGVYFFTTALTEAEAVEEASMCAYLCQGYGLDYPIFMDCESSPRAGYNGMSAGQRTAVIKAFCNTIRSAGYSAGVYANKTWLTSYMHAGELSGYKIWLAQYNAAGPTYTGHYDMWQYTSKGQINGISGYVDMNKNYMGY